MVWSNDKDLLLQKKIAAGSVLGHKQRSRERGAHWQNVADNISEWVMKSLQWESGIIST